MTDPLAIIRNMVDSPGFTLEPERQALTAAAEALEVVALIESALRNPSCKLTLWKDSDGVHVHWNVGSVRDCKATWPRLLDALRKAVGDG